MKLYANVTSERASKGQGGNEYINITLNVGDKPRYFIALYPNETFVVEHIESEKELYRYEVETKGKSKKWQDIDIQTGELVERKDYQKGKSQKGENYLFESVEKTLKRIKDNPIDTRYDE